MVKLAIKIIKRSIAGGSFVLSRDASNQANVTVLVFGACLPQKEGHFSALIFWQPMGSGDQMNPGGVRTVEELQQLLQSIAPNDLSGLRLDPDQAMAFLATQPGHEYWSQCRCYHNLSGQAVLIRCSP